MKKLSTTILSLCVFLLLIGGFFHPISAYTQDLGRHLLLGKIILQTHAVPKTNLFSYTYQDFPFINTHWLSEVIFFIVHSLFGDMGLLITTTICTAIAYFLVFGALGEKKSILANAIVSLLYLPILFERTDIRPEIFSFLLLSLFLTILYRYRKQYTRWIFLLPFLELFWVNIHIYFPIGIAVIGLFFIDHIYQDVRRVARLGGVPSSARSPEQNRMGEDVGWDEEATGPVSKKTLLLFFSLLITTLVTLFNPNGLSGALYPFHVFQNYGYTIEENQTVFFLWNYFGGKTTILYFFIAVVCLFITLLFRIKKTRPIDCLLAIFFTYLAVSAERNLPLFVFGTFIPFTFTLSTISPKPTSTLEKIKMTFAIILTLLLLWQTKNITMQKGFGFGVEIGAKPAADFYIKNRIQGPVFNNFDIGSYLDYRLYPNQKVFIDGRPEAYPASFIQNIYIPLQSDPVFFEKEAKVYNFTNIFFSYTDMTPWAQTFLKQIVENKEWKVIYLDDYVVILVKNAPENAALIKKYGMTQDSLRIANNNPQNPLSYLRIAQFFQTVGWPDQQKQIYQKLLQVDSTNCIALYGLATNTLSSENAMYTTRFQELCQ